MSLAAVMDTAIDYDSWLALNTGYCARHRVRLTAPECEAQRTASAGAFSDLRCQGCGGLEDQPEAVDHIGVYGEAKLRRLQLVKPVTAAILLPDDSENEESQAETAARISEHATDETMPDNSLAMALHAAFFTNESMEPLNLADDDLNDSRCFDAEEDEDDEAEPLSILQDFVGDALQDLRMQRLLMELEGIEAEPEIKRAGTIKQPGRRRVRVYMGTCQKCSGYMVHDAKEYKGSITDDEVYRCFNCGWRISPEYHYNRSKGENL